jgi:hypothetical protein
MAFNMKRPVIKGTPLHKASIAKAKESIVSQRRTQADASLVGAGNALGESYIPAAIDYSIDQKAIKIPESGEEKVKKGKKGRKEIDMAELLKEDEDIVENAGLDDKRTVNPNKKDKGYKNWKVREEKENIRLAEENKARLDAASAKRAKAAAEAKKNNTNMDFTTKNPDIVMPEDKPFKPNPKSDIRVMNKEELDAAQEKTINRDALITQEEAGTATGDKGKGKLVKKTKEELAIEAEVKAKTAETLRVETERAAKVKADKIAVIKTEKAKVKAAEQKVKQDAVDIKNEAIRGRNKRKADAREFYGKDVKLTQARLNAYSDAVKKQEAELSATPTEIPEQDDPEPWEIAAQEKRDLNSNTPQNAPVQPEKKGVESEKPKVSSGKQKRLDLKYKLAGPSVRANMEADGYTPLKGKSPMEMRDDRVYRNARVDGPVRKNMIKGGYKPQ